MKKVLLFIAIIAGAALVAAVPVSAGTAESQKAVMEAEIAPQVIQFVGPTDVFETPAIWPEMKYASGEECNPWCIPYVTSLSLQKRTQSPLHPMEWKNILTTDELSIDQKFRKKGKILVTWTVRILAYPPRYEMGWREDADTGLPAELDSKISDPAVQAISQDIRPMICTNQMPDYPQEGGGAFVCANYEHTFKAGQQYGKVYTRMKDVTACGDNPDCEGTVLSRELVMTIPDGGARTTFDPTHSGSMIITPSMFGGELPAKLRLRLEWKNTTPFILYSEANMRNVIITLTRD